MESMISALLAQIRDGSEISETIKTLAGNIDEASKFSLFYSIGIKNIFKIVKKSGQISTRVARRLLRESRKVYQAKAYILLDAIDCGEIGAKSINVLKVLTDSPLIRETAKGVESLKRQVSSDEGEIDIDWKYKFQQLEIELKAYKANELEVLIKEKEREKEMRNRIESPSTDIFSAIKNGNLEKVKEYIAQNKEIININVFGNGTPLQAASKYNNVEIAKYLIDNGADTHEMMEWNPYSDNPLIIAIGQHYIDLIKFFISISCDVDSGVMEAVGQGFTDVLDLLIDNGANLKRFINIFDSPIKEGKFGVVKHLIDGWNKTLGEKVKKSSLP